MGWYKPEELDTAVSNTEASPTQAPASWSEDHSLIGMLVDDHRALVGKREKKGKNEMNTPTEHAWRPCMDRAGYGHAAGEEEVVGSSMPKLPV